MEFKEEPRLTDNLTLVHLRAGTVEVTYNVGHTGLVTHGRGKVDRLLGVILCTRFDGTIG